MSTVQFGVNDTSVHLFSKGEEVYIQSIKADDIILIEGDFEEFDFSTKSRVRRKGTEFEEATRVVS